MNLNIRHLIPKLDELSLHVALTTGTFCSRPDMLMGLTLCAKKDQICKKYTARGYKTLLHAQLRVHFAHSLAF